MNKILLNEDLTNAEFIDSISSRKPNKAAGFDDLNSNVVRHILDSIKKPLFHRFTVIDQKWSFSLSLKNI